MNHKHISVAQYTNQGISLGLARHKSIVQRKRTPIQTRRNPNGLQKR